MSEKFSKEVQARIDGAQEWVDRQQEALERVEGPLRRLDAGEDLSQADRTILAEEFGLYGEELEKAHAAEPNEKMVENILREPIAFFYHRGVDKKLKRFEVRPGGKVDVIDE